jgi:hypothetical protein
MTVSNTAGDLRYGDLMYSSRGLSIVNIVAGVWLIVAPWVLGYGVLNNATWNDVICGILAICFAGFSVYAANVTGSWLNELLGVWLFIAPFVLGYPGGAHLAATTNDIILGLLVFMMALWRLASTGTPEVVTRPMVEPTMRPGYRPV